MAKFSPTHTHLSLTGVFLVITAVIVLVGLTVVAASHTQIFQQHADVQRFNTFAVKGNIFVDTNRNGIQDNNEANYKGQQLPKVTAVLYNQECGPTPTPTPTVTGEVTPDITRHPMPPSPAPTNCKYVQRCLGIACSTQNPSACKCQNVLVCTPTGIPAAAGSGVVPGTPQSPLGKVGAEQGFHMEVANSAKGATVNGYTSDDQKSDLASEQAMNVCHRLPQKVINCSVSIDGTYACISTDTTFMNAQVRITPPFGYRPTSQNPVVVHSATATVDFGINFGGPLPPVQIQPQQ